MILRANWYMSNLLAAASAVAAEGRLYAPAGQARIAMIDPRDVGAAAAAVLCRPGHGGSPGHGVSPLGLVRQPRSEPSLKRFLRY